MSVQLWVAFSQTLLRGRPGRVGMGNPFTADNFPHPRMSFWCVHDLFQLYPESTLSLRRAFLSPVLHIPQYLCSQARCLIRKMIVQESSTLFPPPPPPLSARLFFIQIASWVKLAIGAWCQQKGCAKNMLLRGGRVGLPFLATLSAWLCSFLGDGGGDFGISAGTSLNCLEKV